MLSTWTSGLPEDDFLNHFAADVDPDMARVMWPWSRVPMM
jgi:hypothetical protein